jgi:hypothetical protein
MKKPRKSLLIRRTLLLKPSPTKPKKPSLLPKNTVFSKKPRSWMWSSMTRKMTTISLKIMRMTKKK